MACGLHKGSHRNWCRAIHLSFASLSGLALCSIVQSASAQSPGFPLTPPPPTVPIQPLPSLPVESTPLPNERVFRAPVTNPVPNPIPNLAPSNHPKYRVFVNGDSSLMLQQVKRVEPQAFIQQFEGRRVIQAGVFSTEANARQQTEALAAQGIASEITTSNMGSLLPGNSARGYYVVVPGDRADLPDLRDRAIRLGVQQTSIQLRERPLGPHLAVGPFAQRQQAEAMGRYLKDRGQLDTRIFFDR